MAVLFAFTATKKTPNIFSSSQLVLSLTHQRHTQVVLWHETACISATRKIRKGLIHHAQ